MMATTTKTSSTWNFCCIRIWPRRSTSSIEITEAIDVVLSSPFTELPSGGMMTRSAWGSTTLRKI